jgi:pyridoxine 5-phosphate synthase
LDANPKYIHLAKELNANIIELHTGHYSNLVGASQQEELQRLIAAAKLIASLQMECHAGHGLTYENIKPLAKVDEITMFNIGHFLIGEAIYIGIESAVKQMVDSIHK